MKEIHGQLWDYDGHPGYMCVITTNGTVRKDRAAVMGRGCALEAAKRYPQLPKLLGKFLQERNGTGNVVWKVNVDKYGEHFLMIFPVKHNWFELADITLIKRSASQLAFHAKRNPDINFVLPRPGCGNGGLNWKDVRKVIETILPDNVVIISNELVIMEESCAPKTAKKLGKKRR